MKLNKMSLDLQAYHWLRDQILSGAISPGQRLIQSDLATKLGASRIPIRDALRRLETDGLVTNEGNACIVAANSAEDLGVLYGVRLRIEGFATTLCARHRSPELIPELQDNLKQTKLIVDKGDVQEFLRLDYEFHSRIYLGTNSRQISNCVFVLWRGMPPIAPIAIEPKRMSAALEEHGAIVDAIARQDAAEAERVAIHHVRQAADAVERWIASRHEDGRAGKSATREHAQS